jgi:hypothetical protein
MAMIVHTETAIGKTHVSARSNIGIRTHIATMEVIILFNIT